MAYNFQPYIYDFRARPTQDYREFNKYYRLMAFPNPLNRPVDCLPYIDDIRRQLLNECGIRTVGDLMNEIRMCEGPDNFHYWLLGALQMRNNRNDVTVYTVITTLMELSQM